MIVEMIFNILPNQRTCACILSRNVGAMFLDLEQRFRTRSNVETLLHHVFRFSASSFGVSARRLISEKKIREHISPKNIKHKQTQMSSKSEEYSLEKNESATRQIVHPLLIFKFEWVRCADKENATWNGGFDWDC